MLNFSTYHPFHDSQLDNVFTWGIYHLKTKEVLGYINDKSKCYAICHMLNGDYEKAKVFMDMVGR